MRKGQLGSTVAPEALKAITLKMPAQRRLIGRDVPAIDVPDKTNGSAIYGISPRLPSPSLSQ